MFGIDCITAINKTALMPAFDLNLVRVFDAMMQHRSVSAAAGALNLTQPAVSNALKRLRELTHDDLFVRTRRGMEPTAFALAAGESLAEGLRLIRHGLDRAAPFDPATSRRRFRLLMNEAGEMVFLPRLMPWLHARAPLLDVQVLQLPQTRYLEALETDMADLAIGSLRLKGDALVIKRLFDERYVIACRRNHPIALAGQPPDLATVLGLGHIVVRMPNTPEAVVDRLARTLGWHCRAALEVPHYMVLPGILDETDLITVVPSMVAAELARRSTIVTLPLPAESPRIGIQIAWHTRQQKDEGSRWLRNQITALMASPAA